MLKLSLKEGQYVNIGDDIRIVFAGGTGKHCRLLIDAPKVSAYHAFFNVCFKDSLSFFSICVFYPTLSSILLINEYVYGSKYFVQNRSAVGLIVS